MQPLVSVIIPNFNGELFLDESVSSVLKQSYPYIEVIVVDDGSTDNSLELLAKFKDRIIVIEKENFGAASARNLGLLASNGEFIALLDSDDIWEPNKLSLQMKHLLEADLDLVYCHGREFGDQGNVNNLYMAGFEGDCYVHFKKYPARAIIELGCSSSVFRKSILHKSGLFDTSNPPPTEDWDFFRRFCRYAKVGFCDEILIHYRRHGNNISSRSLAQYYLGNRIAILKMFIDDDGIGIFERRVIWTKFHFASAKSFLKNGRVLDSVRCLVGIFLPVIV